MEICDSPCDRTAYGQAQRTTPAAEVPPNINATLLAEGMNHFTRRENMKRQFVFAFVMLIGAIVAIGSPAWGGTNDICKSPPPEAGKGDMIMKLLLKAD